MKRRLLSGSVFLSNENFEKYYRRAEKARALICENYRKAFEKYEKGIADVEKNYKRGQNLSKADQDREAAIEKTYQDEVKKAKTKYKKDMRG